MLPNFGQFHLLLAKCEETVGPEPDGFTELHEKVVVLRQAFIMAVRLVDNKWSSPSRWLKDELQCKLFTANLTQYLHNMLHTVIRSLHESGLHLLLEARRGFVKAGEEHKDDIEVNVETGDTLDGNVLFKQTVAKTAINLHTWWKALTAGFREHEKFLGVMKDAVPVDGPLFFDLAPFVKAAAEGLAESENFVKAKKKVAHLTIVQAAFRPLGSGDARSTLQEQGKAQVARLGVALSPKFSFLLGKA